MKFVKSIIFLVLVFTLVSLEFGSGQSEPTTHKIIITNNKFTPSTLEIDIGDVVIFEWDENAFGHNAAQTKNSKSLNWVDNGFHSGDPASGPKTWEVPHEYLNTNITLFYVCEPHGTDGMRGKIIVGAGSEEEKTPGFLQLSMVIPTFLLIAIRKRRIQVR